MSEVPRVSRKNIIQYQNPNPIEDRNLDIRSLVPKPDEIFAEVIKKEIPNARNAEGYTPLTDDEIKDLITESDDDVVRIEEAARNPNRWIELEKIAKNSTRVIVCSAPGTYYQRFKKDPYEEFKWASGMDRQRSDISAIVGIHIAGIATGNDFSEFTNYNLLDGLTPKLDDKRDLVRQAIEETDIRFVYLGTSAEAEAIRKVLRTQSSFIPNDKVDIIESSDPKYNTLGQVLDLKSYLKSHIQAPGTNVIIPMGIQAIRAFPMMRKVDAIPEDLNVFLFPIPTPANGIREYATMETKGRVYYTLTGAASREMASHALIGTRS